MTDQVQDQEVELDEAAEVVDEAHDPKNAEAQSVASVDAAGDATKTAPKRKGDKSNSEPMPKTKAGMVNAMYGKLQAMKKTDLQASYKSMMGEEVEMEDDVVVSEHKEDLQALIANEEGLAEGFKEKAATIFEAAVNSKVNEAVSKKEAELEATIAERVTALEEQYATEIEEGLNETRGELVEKIDSYLNYVVETWMEENKLAVEAGLRTEIAETFMNNLKDLFTESYIEVPESKIDLVDDLVEQVEELENQLNSQTEKNMQMSESVKSMKKEVCIREASKDLAETQVEKLRSLAESVDFTTEEDFASKISTLKESYFAQKPVETTEAPVEMVNESVVEEEADETEVSSNMDKYLSALRTS
jgi:hypothetical protein